MTGNDIAGLAESAKNAAVVLTAFSGVAYACGYLGVRARALALGADTGFAIIDQIYVLAGFRFIHVLLLELLISAPLLLLLSWLGKSALLLGPNLRYTVEAGAAVAAGALTIWIYLVTDVKGVLLAPTSKWTAGAVLGKNAYGVLLVLGTTAATAALLLWSRAHYLRAGEVDPLGAALALITMLLLLLLPVQHGVFHAGRLVARLEVVPAGVGGLTPPIWVVDRAADRVTLFGRGADGRARLVTVKANQLDGVAVVGIGTLSDAVGEKP